MRRRTVLWMPAALWAQAPGLHIQWIEGPLSEDIARDCVVFPRAYTCCPDRGAGRRALEMSRFPHVQRERDISLPRLLAGERVTIYTAESADGGDGPEERTVRVPLAIRWPEKLSPRVANEVLISHADVLPTLLGLAGVRVPDEVQGRDLSDRLATGRGELPSAVYAEGRIGYVDEWRLLVRGFDKLVWSVRGDITGLYNLAEDPQEQANLMDRRDYTLTRDSMWALAREWMRRLEDGMDASGLRLRR